MSNPIGQITKAVHQAFGRRITHEGVVKLLDRKDVNSNRADMHDQSLFRWVAFAGHEELSSYRDYLAGRVSTPITQMRMIERRSDALLGMDMKEWSSFTSPDL